MAEVPTGYLGPETPEEDELSAQLKTIRESIPTRLRFDIMKRDGHRCQLCGLTPDDGVQLHIDHRVPLAKGGTNHVENLWTLCDRCNLGKSDTLL
jgi:5-methylcytosine-specific restriction endonuclease McrA